MEHVKQRNWQDVKKRVERYCADKGLKEVHAVNIYDAKPDLKLLYSIPFN